MSLGKYSLPLMVWFISTLCGNSNKIFDFNLKNADLTYSGLIEFRKVCIKSFWTPFYQKGSYVTTPLRSSMVLVRSLIGLWISGHWFSLKLCMKLGVYKVKKVTRQEF